MKFFLLAFLFAAVLAPGFVLGDLKGVAILFRHGERTPQGVLPNYGDSHVYRELGPGQLTLGGSKQLYDNGVDLRSRYSSLLPKSGYFRSSNMKVVSSSVERCIVSLTSFMAGFLPPPATDKTIPFRWQAFPFAVDNEARIVTINFESCAKYAKELATTEAALTNGAQVKAWLVQDKAVLTRVGDYIGSPCDTMFGAMMAAEMIRTNQYLISTPAWLVKDYEQTLQKYFAFYTDMYHNSDFMKKVRGGVMMTQILNNFAAIRDNTTDSRNVLIFSAHDFNVHSMVVMLNVKSQVPQVPFYADTIALELHQSGKSEPEVRAYYISSTGTTKFKTLLSIPSCGSPCRLNKFTTLMSKYVVTDYDGMCKL